MAQKQRLAEVRTDFEQSEQTIVNKALDQWSKQAFAKTKGQHFEHSLFVIFCILWTAEMFKTILIISENSKKFRCRTCAVDQRELFCFVVLCQKLYKSLFTEHTVASKTQHHWLVLIKLCQKS